jgi:SMC interacting uncharacterized protein involved in chromosome segregation
MRTKAPDDFLIQLAQDIATLKTTIDASNDHLDRIDEKVVEPFQEWLYIVKNHCEQEKSIRTYVSELEKKITDHENVTDERLKNQDTAIKAVNDKLDKILWYTAGVLGTIIFLATIIYQVLPIILTIIKR